MRAPGPPGPRGDRYRHPVGGLPADPDPRTYRPQAATQGRWAHRAWTAAGVLSPFALAVLLYPLVWWPVWALLVPAAEGARAVLLSVVAFVGAGHPAAGAPQAPPPPGGPMPWDAGPRLSPGVALCWAAAFLAARSLCARLARPTAHSRKPSHPAAPDAGRAFAAGLRAALLVAVLAAVWWANGALVGP